MLQSIDSKGITSFYSGWSSNQPSGLVLIATQETWAAAVDYLLKNNIGEGTTVAFKTASSSELLGAAGNSGVDTVVYTQYTTTNGATGGYGLVALYNQTALGLTTSASNDTTNGYIHIDSF